MAMKKKKLDHDKPDRKFTFLVYEDSTDYDYKQVLENVKEYGRDQEWSYIRHDKDIDENEKLKKPHYHVCMRFQSPRVRKTVARQIGLGENYHIVERIQNWRLMNRYHLHLDDEDKYPYGFRGVVSNFDFVGLVDVNRSEDLKMRELFTYMYVERPNNITEVIEYVFNNNLWSDFRRNYTIIKDVLFEINHNLDILGKEWIKYQERND